MRQSGGGGAVDRLCLALVAQVAQVALALRLPASVERDPVKAAVSHRARRQRQSVDYSTPPEQAVGSRLKCRLAVIGGKAVALIQK